ncbi:hypothetical protein D6856_14360 [Butyrivibrio sp. XB500-5]|uniref:metallophosphoesterase n=1 Tax=Butyrivibrio sp. XB500-5 TaxID=2364880 RepID=UPI000EA9E193|nr:metallophosphoesterase [Butyrivibrio sp. XB500-5]RKM56956.1 hypothetical protein D6856_14360 [Butyrivibrio sp. XB500-5]
MKRKFAFKSLLSLAVAGTLFCGSAISAFAEDIGDYKIGKPDDTLAISKIAEDNGGDLSGKTVILSTNDTHGAILQYAYFAALKNYFHDELKATDVLLVDSGDFSSDKKDKDKISIEDYKLYGHLNKADHPERSIELMNDAKYDYACLGNHEFDYGFDTLKSMLDSAEFTMLDANIIDSKKKLVDANKNPLYLPHTTITTNNSGLKIGFFGLDTIEVESQDIKPYWGGNNQGISIEADDALHECAQTQVNELKKTSDIIVCLSHLGLEEKFGPGKKEDHTKNKIGVRSADVWNNTDGIDLILDAHSHTGLNGGENNARILSTQIWGNYLGVSVIDNNNPKNISTYLVADGNYETVFGSTTEERLENLIKYGAGDVIDDLVGYLNKDYNTKEDNAIEALDLFKYVDDEELTIPNIVKSGKDSSSNDKNHGKNGRNNGKNNGKNDKNSKHGKNGKHSKNDRNSKSNSRFGKRSFEYDEEDFELEEDTQAIEDASTEATTADENAEITSEANDESSTQLDEQSTDAASTDESTEATEQTDEQDNAEQNEDAEVDPAA